MSKVSAYYHIVFCTKSRSMTIPLQYKEDLYRFLWNEIKKMNSTLIRIGGIQNHVHILLDLNAAVPLANLVRSLKSNSSAWMQKDPRFAHFAGWASEYFAVTVSPEQKDGVIEYIKNQEEHHNAYTADEEFMKLYSSANQVYDPLDMQ